MIDLRINKHWLYHPCRRSKRCPNTSCYNVVNLKLTLHGFRVTHVTPPVSCTPITLISFFSISRVRAQLDIASVLMKCGRCTISKSQLKRGLLIKNKDFSACDVRQNCDCKLHFLAVVQDNYKCFRERTRRMLFLCTATAG